MLDVTRENSFSLITINNPPVNALSSDLIRKLKQTLIGLQSEPDIKAVLITGAGRTFCAGADIKELSALKTKKEGKEFAQNGQDLMNIIEYSAIPIIAAINGACVGGGNELAMACHIRIASEDAWFSQPEINLGIIPGFYGTQRLPKLVGMAKAVELILTGDRITSQEALSMGLVNRIVPSAELMKTARELADKISKKGKIAINACLQAIHGIEDEDKLFGKVCDTDDKEEGIKAFLEKRQAVFKDK